MKKILAFALTLCMVFALCACGQTEPAPVAPAAPAEPAAPAAPAAPVEKDEAVEPLVLKFASLHNEGSSRLAAAYKFSELVKEASDGQIIIEVYPSSQLGNQTDVFEGMQMGTIDFASVSLSGMESFDSRFALFTFFLLDGEEHAYKFFYSDLAQEMFEDFASTLGVRALAPETDGEMVYWHTDKFYDTMDQFKGVNLRVPETTIQIAVAEAMGCNPAVVPFGDLYTGFQTGIVNGMQMVAESVTSAQLQEVLKARTIATHDFIIAAYMMSEITWQSLTPEQQQIISDCAKQASEYQLELFHESMDKVEQILEDAGVQTLVLEGEALENYKALVNAAVDEHFSKFVDLSVVNQIRDMAKK